MKLTAYQRWRMGFEAVKTEEPMDPWIWECRPRRSPHGLMIMPAAAIESQTWDRNGASHIEPTDKELEELRESRKAPDYALDMVSLKLGIPTFFLLNMPDMNVVWIYQVAPNPAGWRRLKLGQFKEWLRLIR